MDKTRKLIAAPLALLMLTSVTACGTQPADRAISGAFLGAAAGGAVFALFPGNAVALGIATGGALGGIVGGLSLPDYLYMGEPAWQRQSINSEYQPQPSAQINPNMQQNPAMMQPQQPQYGAQPPATMQQQYQTAPQQTYSQQPYTQQSPVAQPQQQPYVQYQAPQQGYATQPAQNSQQRRPINQ